MAEESGKTEEPDDKADYYRHLVQMHKRLAEDAQSENRQLHSKLQMIKKIIEQLLDLHPTLRDTKHSSEEFHAIWLHFHQLLHQLENCINLSR